MRVEKTKMNGLLILHPQVYLGMNVVGLWRALINSVLRMRLKALNFTIRRLPG